MKIIIIVLFMICTVFANANGQLINPEVLDGGRKSMVALLDALVERDLDKAKAYASEGILERIELYGRYENIFTGRERIVDYEILGTTGYVSVDESEDANPPISVFILRYQLEKYEGDCYGISIWVYKDKRWQFVSFPSSELNDFPFRYTSD